MRSETLSGEFRDGIHPWGYLVPGNAGPSIRRHAATLAAQGVEVIADNGYFDDISRIATQYRGPAAALYRQVQTHERELDRTIRPGELPIQTRDGYRQLAKVVRTIARQVTDVRQPTLTAQTAMLPTRLIGAEDITMAVLLALNIEPAYIQLHRRDYRRANERVAALAAREAAQLPARFRAGYYPVASAVDYNTAFDAGKVFAAKGISQVAMGFGAFMADNHYTDHVFLGRRRIDLGGRMPNRYVRTITVARGFFDGYQAKAAHLPAAFHFLGLGAPIMIGLVALCAFGTPLLTFDATSPFKDAVQGTMYLTRPAPLKVRTRRIASQIASGTRGTWACTCAFCRSFATTHLADYAAARAWRVRIPDRDPTAADLRPNGALFSALPLFSEPASGPLRRAVTLARIGHNHWALTRLLNELNKASATREGLSKHVEATVTSYAKATSVPRFGAAIDFARRLSENAV